MAELWLRFCIWASLRFLSRRARRQFSGYGDCPEWLWVWATLPKKQPWPWYIQVQEDGPLKGAPLVCFL